MTSSKVPYSFDYGRYKAILVHCGKIYNKHIKGKVSEAAFKEYIYLKEKCEKKLKYVKYTKFAIQPYLTSKKLSMEEKKLLFSLRSKCYPAKMNYRKQFKGNTQCSLKCRTNETQDHIF